MCPACSTTYFPAKNMYTHMLSVRALQNRPRKDGGSVAMAHEEGTIFTRGAQSSEAALVVGRACGAQLLACEGDGVLHEHRDGHRPHAPRHRRDQPRSLPCLPRACACVYVSVSM
jgi:hypothetical protein